MLDQTRISLVLVRSGQDGLDALELAKAWAEAGLIQRAFWLSPENVIDGDIRSAWLIQQGLQRPVAHPLREIARMRLTALQVLVLQTPSTQQPSDPDQLAAATRLRETVISVLPRPQTDEDQNLHWPVEVQWLDLIAPHTGVQGLDQERVAVRGFTTVLASPEDRRAPWQTDALVRPGQDHIAWATAQAVSLLGLWMGIAESPVGEFEERFDGVQNGRERPGVAMQMRSFVRVVESTDVVREAMDRAIDELKGNSENIVLPAEDFAPHPDPEFLPSEFAEAMGDLLHDRLESQPFIRTPDPPQQKMRLRQILGMAWHYSAQEVANLPRDWWWLLRATYRRRMQRRIEGDEGQGHIELTLGGYQPPDELLQAEFEQRFARNELAFDALRANTVTSSHPRVWATMRAGVLGMLDGSPMPTELERLAQRTDQGRRRILEDPGQAVPVPEPWTVAFAPPRGVEGVELPDQVTLLPGDPEVADATLEQLQQTVDQLQAKLAEVQAELDGVAREIASSEGEVAETERELGALQELPPVRPGQAGPSPDHTAREAELRGRIIDVEARLVELQTKALALQARLATIGDVLAKAASALGSLQAWMVVVESSAMGRFARLLHTARTGRAADAQRAAARATAMPDFDYGEARRTRNAFVKKAAWLTAFTVAGVTAGVLWFDDLTRAIVDTASDQTWTIILLWTLLVGLVVTLAYRLLKKNFQRHSQFLRKKELAEHALSEAEAEFRHCYPASVRLSASREQVRDWTLILGHVVHDPWRTPELASSDDEADLHLPFCVDLARPTLNDPQTSEYARSTALRSLCPEGWRSALYDLIVHEAGVLDPASGTSLPGLTRLKAWIDADSPSERNGTRSRLLGQLEDPDGRVKQSVTTQTMGRAIRSVLEFKLTDIAIEPVRGDLLAESKDVMREEFGIATYFPAAKEFLSDILDDGSSISSAVYTDVIRAAGEQPPVRTIAWFPEGKSPPEIRTVGPEVTLVRNQPDRPILMSTEPSRNRGLDISVRIDLAEPVPLGQLAAFQEITVPATHPEDRSQVPEGVF